MAIQLSVTVRNARLDAIETAIGAAAVLKLWTGAQPANCAAADTGILVASMILPADWMAAAAAGAKALAGTWEDASADSTNTAAHFRLYASGGAVCHAQGSVSASGGGGDLGLLVNGLPSAAITAGDDVVITSFTLTDANA